MPKEDWSQRSLVRRKVGVDAPIVAAIPDNSGIIAESPQIQTDVHQSFGSIRDRSTNRRGTDTTIASTSHGVITETLGSNSSGGSGNGSAGGNTGPSDATSPFDRLADAFMAAVGGGPSTPQDTTPYVVVDPNYSTGESSMNWKTIAVVALIGVAIWWAWKKWGGKVASAASSE
jgi:LPXTG-motif cell wall-anchored protein